jgi:serine/threonine protein kinase
MKTTCPNPEELLEYLACEDDEDSEIGRHIESCEDCQQALDEESEWGVLDQFRQKSSAVGTGGEAEACAADTTILAKDQEDTTLDSRLKNIPRESHGVALNGEADLPSKIGRYEVLTKIGEGGLGEVYLAYDRDAGRECAIKLLSGRRPKSHSVLRQCVREMKSLWKLGLASHGTASRLEGDGGLAFFVMGYARGVDLDEWVRTNGPLSVRDACRAAVHVAIALHEAHSVNVLHLGIKPSNLFLDHNGSIVVLDCGLAPLIQDELSQADFTKSALVKGSVDFMSPEHARDAALADNRSDIYSLGCTLAFLLSGRRLFATDSVMQTVVAHRQAAVPDVSRLAGGAPQTLNAVLAKLLAKAPADRYQSMAEVALALQTFFGDEPAKGDIISMPNAPEEHGNGIRSWLSSVTKRRN